MTQNTLGAKELFTFSYLKCADILKLKGPQRHPKTTLYLKIRKDKQGLKVYIFGCNLERQ